MTHDNAERMVVWKVNSPESVQRKVGSLHDLSPTTSSRRR
ncbi:hypothetical protein SBD_7149 [Streptomyces bottropensis ATCC 25435]|uniref:Uncharacterized protein n=1 Tax=Streptomyces bottropensis ATCC 25435 TaxID=1054862 RepID=M3FHF1_9ACTN|nr:hypothetical protein SBD_7149 [Streptomyces bottropensis ATCC 25435]